MIYLVNDVMFIEGLESRYVKVTFKDNNDKTELYYLIEKQTISMIIW